MKTFVFLLCSVMFALTPKNSFSQDADISISKDKVMSVKQVFKLINKQADYKFIYRHDLIKKVPNLSLNKGIIKVSALLNKYLTPYGLSYSFTENSTVIVHKKHSNIKVTIQQQLKINGTITGSDGIPLVGASIIEKGTTNGTQSDFDGIFSLSVTDEDAVVVISYLGFITKEISIKGKSSFDIELQEDAAQLDEIVIVGYGTQKKKDLTGAIDQVSAKTLENRPVADISAALQGVVPNLNISSRNGAPGASGNFNIRGYTSINGGSPLILVDGVEMDPDLINVNDIESVTVLKDAGSAAIYGARAAFGVVLITTKTGKVGKTKVTFNEKFIWSKPTITPDVIGNSYEQAVAVNEALSNYDGSTLYNANILDKMKAYYEDPANNPEWDVVNGDFEWYGYNDYQSEVLRDYAPTQIHALSMSGGNERTTYYSSLSFSNQEGLIKQGVTDSYKKINMSLSVNDQTFPWLKTRTKITYNRNTKASPFVYKSDERVANTLVFSRPTGLPTRYPGDDPLYQGMYFETPASTLLLGGRNNSEVNLLSLTMGATATVNEHLSFITDFTYNIYRNGRANYKKRVEYLESDFNIGNGRSNNDYIYESSTKRNYYVLNSYAQYDNDLIDDLNMKAMVGFSQEFSDSEYISAQRFNLINPEQGKLNLATGDQEVGGGTTQWALRGLFTRFNFNYKGKYLLTFNGRYDGSSRFPQNTFDFFPSVSVGWILSEEGFMENTNDIISNLKLRGSYGSLGNQSISVGGSQQYYPATPGMSSGNTRNFLFSDTPELYINPPGLVSPSLTWETATTLNIGIDLELFKGKIGASFDWYKRTTSDMLLKVSYPHVLGASAPWQNGAELETKGWEFSMNYRENFNNGLTLSTKFVLADNQAEITKYENKTGALNDYYVGQKLGDIWGYETVGIFQTQADIDNAANQSQINSTWAPGDIQYADLNGDGVINTGDNTLEDPGDRKVIGNSTPRYTYGLTTDLAYKGIFLNVFFQGVGKRDYWPSVQGFWPYATQWYQVQKHFVSDSWSVDNPNAYFSRPLARSSQNRQTQSRYLQNASYIRLKNITLGYNLPESWINKIGVKNMQVYVSGQNIWEHSKIGKPLDPEINTGDGSTSHLGYPYMRSYSLGLNLTF